jgi:pimeloyl-ACP methyl ester carboxylesterase
MRRLLLFLSLFSARVAQAAAPEPDCVVLLHGIGMQGYVMKRIESALVEQGYRVVNISYPSRELPFEKLAGEYLPAQLLENDVARAPRLHFITHSLGSLIVRKLIQDTRPANLGRVVMIGPPNHGSVAADEAGEYSLLREYMGENLGRLGTGDNSIVSTLGPADFDVGIIAGNTTSVSVFGRVLSGQNDGAVTVESARLEGMHDFIVVPYSHTVMLWRDEVVQQALTYLREGKFKHPAADAAIRQ